MKQAVVTAPFTMTFKEVEEPRAGVGEVVVRIKRIGICGSDLHVFKGRHPLVKFPLVQGHEFSGFVEAIGEAVDGLAEGDLVTVEPAVGCGRCDRCLEGRFAECDHLLFIGGALTGAGSELFRVRSDHVVKLPAGTDPDDAAMVEPLSVAVHAVGAAGEIARRRVLVAGGGTIGNLTAQVARLSGASKVIILETNDQRGAIARRLEFETLDPRAGSIGEELDAAYAGRPIDVAFECVGHEAPLGLCIEKVRRGGTVVVLGVYEHPAQVAMIAVQDKELHLVGSLMYTWEDYRSAVELIEHRAVRLDLLRSHHFPFERWPDAYELLMQQATPAMKVMIDL